MAVVKTMPRPDSNDAIGARLRAIRIAYGYSQGQIREMSQAEFARLCDIGAAAWNNAETGDNRIGLDSALKVRRKTGISLDYIFTGDERGLPHALAIELAKLDQEAKHARRA